MPSTSRPATRQLLLAVMVSLALGVASSFGQGSSWEVLSAACDSWSPWTLVAAALAATTRRPVLGAILGSLSLLGLVVGYYYIASLGRGFPVATSSVLFWAIASIVVGSLVGALVALARQRSGGVRAIACGVLAGVMVSEGVRDLTVVGDTVPAAWALICISAGVVTIAIGAALNRQARFVAVLLAVASSVSLALSAVTSADMIGYL